MDLEARGVAIGDHLVIVFAAQKIGAKERAVVVSKAGLRSPNVETAFKMGRMPNKVGESIGSSLIRWRMSFPS